MSAVQAVRQMLPRLHNWLAPRCRAEDGVQTAHSFTTVLCVTPSFMSGVARLYGFWGELDAHSNFTDKQYADWTALDADYQAVALDFQRATNLVLEQQDPPVDQDDLNSILEQIPSSENYDPTPQKAIQEAP